MSREISAALARLKRGVAVVGIAIAVILSLIGVAIGSAVIMATTTGADPRDVLHEPQSGFERETSAVAWNHVDGLVRSLEPSTQRDVGSAWVRSISAVERAITEGDRGGIDVWFSGPAHDDAVALVELSGSRPAPDWSEHEITPSFYSLDGQVLVAAIRRVSVSGEPDLVRAVFILRDGNWRVEHLIRTA